MRPPMSTPEAKQTARIDDPRPPLHTAAIVNVTLAGIIAATHVGKATIALPQMHEEFGRSLQSLSWIMSVFPLMGVFGGIAAGLLVQRWGDRRLLGFGLITLALASTAGAYAHSFAWLIATRLVEGLGFLIIVVAAPAILNRLASPRQHHWVFGIWSTFMAAGVAASLLLGPLLGDWRHIWLVTAGFTLLAALLLQLTTPTAAQPARPLPWHDTLLGVRRMLKARSPGLLALAFAAYTLQYFAVLSFLPIFLMQRMSVTVGMAGILSAAVVASGILGNVLAAPLLTRGIRPSTLLAGTSIVMGLAGVGVFLPALPATIAVACCLVFSALGGIVPATLITRAPQATPDRTLAPLCLGLVMQGNYLGQVLGPIAISTAVSVAGWPAAAIPVLAAAMCGVMLGLWLKPNNRGVHHAY